MGAMNYDKTYFKFPSLGFLSLRPARREAVGSVLVKSSLIVNDGCDCGG